MFGAMSGRPKENEAEWLNLKGNIPHYERLIEEAKKDGNKERERFFEGIKEIHELYVGEIELELNKPLTTEPSLKELRNEVENNEWVTLERLKKFKENSLTLAGVTIVKCKTMPPTSSFNSSAISSFSRRQFNQI